MRVFAMAGVISISMVGCAHEIKNIRNVSAVKPVTISPYKLLNKPRFSSRYRNIIQLKHHE